MSNQGWHVEKGIPLALLFFLICQLGTAVWMFAQMDTRLEVVEARTQALENQYKDVPQRLVRLEVLLERIDRKLERLSNQR